MKPGIHPRDEPAACRDTSVGSSFLTRSTSTSGATIEWTDGQTYPLVDVEVSSRSHPSYTGRTRTLDTAGRVEKFERRYGTSNSRSATSSSAASTSDTSSDA